jgi:ABC-type multidrug transport system ATPase subunit
VGGDCIITGSVLVNDKHMPLAKLKKIMGFVPQDDTVHTDLTVRYNYDFTS